jgi:multicomponent Na+:H+ antiporter subunit E
MIPTAAVPWRAGGGGLEICWAGPAPFRLTVKRGNLVSTIFQAVLALKEIGRQARGWGKHEMAGETTVERKQTKTGSKLGAWIQAPFLFGVWMLLSGKFDVFHLGSGVVAVLLVVWLDRKLGPVNLGENDLPIRIHVGRAILFVPWLVWQMLLSALEVARIILRPNGSLDPRLVRFTCVQPHTIARVLLGNSITLTPGTLTLNIEGDHYLIHSLSAGSREGLFGGGMQKKVARLFCAEELGSVSDALVVANETGGGIPQ